MIPENILKINQILKKRGKDSTTQPHTPLIVIHSALRKPFATSIRIGDGESLGYTPILAIH